MIGKKYLTEEAWKAAIKASLISPWAPLGFDPKESFEEAYRGMSDAELEREAVSNGVYSEEERLRETKRFVGKVLGSFGANNAPQFLESSGVSLEDVVEVLKIQDLKGLENIGYTPNVWRGLGYHLAFGNEGKIERIYRRLPHECVQCYPKG